MAYDEGLAERIRGALDEQPGVSEKRMFGGVAFLVNGHMSVGIVQDKLMVRVGQSPTTVSCESGMRGGWISPVGR